MRHLIGVLLTVVLAVDVAWGQTPAAPVQGGQRGTGAAAPGGGGRGGGRGPQIVSPEVRADRTITFRFSAPNAKEVVLIGELDGKTHPMTRDERGVWSVTVGPWPPDVYNYQFRADGVIAMDPQNPNVKLGWGGFPPANLVEVPGDGLEFDDAKNVPHGSVRIETYHSKSLGVPRTIWVYTPPGYDRGNTRYPVFYLLHGSGNTDSSWILTGRANLILDNLIAEGKARPMILVHPFGYARQGVGLGPEITPAAGSPAAASGARGGGGSQPTPFARDLVEDVMPFVERSFRVLSGADNRALGGLSMGGGQTIQIGFANPDLFRSLIIMSAGSTNAETTYPEFFNAAVTNKKIKLLWMSVGKDDFALANARALDAALTAKGIRHTFRVTEGRHEWVIWRHHLREVAPLLFR
jgi:enterochelin esterase family protein